MRLIRVAAAVALGVGLLAVWRATHPLHCAALAAPALVALILLIALREGALRRRRCLAACAFQPETTLRAFFSGALYPTLTSLILALALALALMLDIATWDERTLAVLLIDLLLLFLLLRVIDRATRRAVQPGMRPVVVKAGAALINALFLLGGLVALKFLTPIPAYKDPNLTVMIANATATVGSACAYLDAALQIQLAKEALGWWAILTGDAAAAGGGYGAPLRWGAWALFLASGSLSAFAFSRYMAEFMYRADHLEDGDGRDGA